MSCHAVRAPNTSWNFCPSMGASAFFVVLFAATTLVHLYQAIRYRKRYCWVIVMSGIWQCATYLFRSISISSPASSGLYVAWFTLILVAPIWTNAFVYMIFGRMVWNFSPQKKLWSLKPWYFGLVFVLLDILAFIVQAYGAASAAGDDISKSQILHGLHVYMGGVGLQLLFILAFCFFAGKLFLTLRGTASPSSSEANNAAALKLLYVLFAVLFLICLRIVFRLAEYSSGLDSSIPNHEAYQYTLDSLPMLVALGLFNWIHPGQIMPGASSDLPSIWKQMKSKRSQEERREAGHDGSLTKLVVISTDKATNTTV